MIINLLIQLLACYMDLFCIHNDYIIAGINVRGVLRLVLASQYFSYFRCQTAKGLALCVFYIPFCFIFRTCLYSVLLRSCPYYCLMLLDFPFCLTSMLCLCNI